MTKSTLTATLVIIYQNEEVLPSLTTWVIELRSLPGELSLFLFIKGLKIGLSPEPLPADLSKLKSVAPYEDSWPEQYLSIAGRCAELANIVGVQIHQ